jgi:flavin reductase (DIM6/NTAB) family NADH-FMN oxidoreductase RutF
MIPPPTATTLEALNRIPNGEFLLTTAFGDILDGRIVERVQQCGTNPPMLLVAMEKGHVLSPLIRDSRTFAVSLLDPNERLVQRVFGPDRRIGENPFLTYPFTPGVMGAPIVTRATAWFDCEVVRHLDMETNYELYIGLVHAAGLGTAPVPRLNAALHATRRPEVPGSERRLPRLRAPIEPAAAESPAERLRGKSAPAVPPVPAAPGVAKKGAHAPAPRRRTGR